MTTYKYKNPYVEIFGKHLPEHIKEQMHRSFNELLEDAVERESKSTSFIRDSQPLLERWYP